MKIGFSYFAGCGLLVVATCAQGADPAQFKDNREKASYGVGVYFGNQIKRSSMDVDVDTVSAAIKDVLAGKETRLTDPQAQEAIAAYQKESQGKAAEKNKKEGEAFLAENKKKPGVKTHKVTLPDGITAEMQYKVITEGTGAMPKSNDTVHVNYRGTLINGKEFDSSAKHGGPLARPANSLVKGWTEALQMMKTGSKWELYLPSALAYGDRGGQGIEPGAALIFEMELLSFDTPQPPPPPQPLTSDIIRVPSAEELKAGAKVEVIKAEDLEKMTKAAAATNSAGKKP
jgi:FKBP-type peptidyl-prolyl cis-trans isomerase FklB